MVKLNLIHEKKKPSEFAGAVRLLPEVIVDELAKLKKPRNILVALAVLLTFLLMVVLRNPQLFISDKYEKVFKSPVIYGPRQQ